MSIKISQLPPAENFTDTDVIPLVQEGITKKILVSKILNLIPEDEPDVIPTSDLPPADPLTGPELVAVMQEGEMRQTTVADFDAAFAHPYDIGCGLNGTIPSEVTLLRYPFPRKVVFKAGLPLSRGFSGVKSTLEYNLDIRRNNVSIGTITFTSASEYPTFTMAENAVFNVGDVMTIVSSSIPDDTLADLGIVIAGFRGDSNEFTVY